MKQYIQHYLGTTWGQLGEFGYKRVELMKHYSPDRKRKAVSPSEPTAVEKEE